MKTNRKIIILSLMTAMMMTGCTFSPTENDAPKPTDNKETEKQPNKQTAIIETNNKEKNEIEITDEREQPKSNESIRLAVPQILQETNYYCAVACLQMVLAYHGIEASQDTLAAVLNTSPVTGTEYEDLAREASIYIFGKVPENNTQPGYRALLWNRNEGTNPMKEQFFTRTNTDLRSGDPVFIALNPAMVYEEGTDAVHEVVLYGADFDEQGNATHYYCIDPYGKYQDIDFGGKKVFTADELWNAMNNNPEPGYVW